jgi:predicted Zn-dependent protease
VCFHVGCCAQYVVQNQQKILSDNDASAIRIKSIGMRILQTADENYVPANQWIWTVLNDNKVVNAFVMPGGGVVVYTGLLRVAKTDDELAAVLVKTDVPMWAI